jgi:hypothetical protein
VVLVTGISANHGADKALVATNPVLVRNDIEWPTTVGFHALILPAQSRRLTSPIGAPPRSGRSVFEASTRCETP